MSSTYVVLNPDIKQPPLLDGGMLDLPEDWDEDYDYSIIGGTHGFIFKNWVLTKLLPDDTPIYSIDNDTDLKTLGDLRVYYKLPSNSL